MNLVLSANYYIPIIIFLTFNHKNFNLDLFVSVIRPTLYLIKVINWLSKDLIKLS